MKYVLALALGIAFGVAVFAVGLAYNPFAGTPSLSPLATTDAQTLSLAYSAVASDSIIYTNDGESSSTPYPDKVQQLWEAPIRQTEATAAVFRDGSRRVAGIGLKISSASESTRLIEGKALRDSVWYIYLPGRGSLFIEQTENYWDYLRDIVLPAHRSSSGTWKGTWTGVMTSGPDPAGIARVVGSSGDFEGRSLQGVETLSVRTWRDSTGPLAADGQLTIELRERQASN